MVGRLLNAFRDEVRFEQKNTVPSVRQPSREMAIMLTEDNAIYVPPVNIRLLGEILRQNTIERGSGSSAGSARVIPFASCPNRVDIVQQNFTALSIVAWIRWCQRFLVACIKAVTSSWMALSSIAPRALLP